MATGADEIWHADLYRLTHPDEVLELGLDDAFGRAICLVEWPDRLGRHVPPDALRLRFVAEGDGRRVHSDGGAPWAGAPWRSCRMPRWLTGQHCAAAFLAAGRLG